MKTKHTEDHCTAYHEAGHAVIGRVLGLICSGATIVPNHDEGEAGHHIVADPWATYYHWDKAFMEQIEQGIASPRYREVRSVLCARIITYMAGAETERIICGQCRGGDGDDRYQIELMASSPDAEFTEDLWERYEPRMRRQTRRLIHKHRDKIERVARALIERRTLEGNEVDALM